MGKILQQHFAELGYDVVVLSRSPKTKSATGIRHMHWDASSIGPWAKELESAKAVINLAGRSVDCRYTAKNKALILNSRVNATRVLGDAIAACTTPPETWINLSSATVYRHAEDRPQDEFTGELGTDFSPGIVKAWEKEFFCHTLKGVRQVAVRSAIVLSNQGGAWPMYVGITKAGLGGAHGSGNQFVSWIHEEDVKHFFNWIIDTPTVEGIIDLASPNPLPQRAFMEQIRQHTKPIFHINAPVWMLTIGAFFMGTETELILKSRQVIPTKALQLGYIFKHAHIGGAMTQLFTEQLSK